MRLFLQVLVLALAVPMVAQSDEATIVRAIGDPATLAAKFKFAEFVQVAGDAPASFDLHGEPAFKIELKKAASGHEGVLTYSKFSFSQTRQGEEFASLSTELARGVNQEGGPGVLISNDRIRVDSYAPLRTLMESMDGDSTVRDGVWRGLSVAASTESQVALVWPTLPSAPMKVGTRFDAHSTLGRLSNDHVLRAFYVNEVLAIDPATVTLQQSGKLKLLVEPVAKDVKAPKITLDEANSYWSYRVVIERSTGLLKSCEGEFLAPLELVAADAPAGTKAERVNYKIWTKVE